MKRKALALDIPIIIISRTEYHISADLEEKITEHGADIRFIHLGDTSDTSIIY